MLTQLRNAETILSCTKNDDDYMQMKYAQNNYNIMQEKYKNKKMEFNKIYKRMSNDDKASFREALKRDKQKEIKMKNLKRKGEIVDKECNKKIMIIEDIQCRNEKEPCHEKNEESGNMRIDKAKNPNGWQNKSQSVEENKELKNISGKKRRSSTNLPTKEDILSSKKLKPTTTTTKVPVPKTPQCPKYTAQIPETAKILYPCNGCGNVYERLLTHIKM